MDCERERPEVASALFRKPERAIHVLPLPVTSAGRDDRWWKFTPSRDKGMER
jgi:hypothetical protein